MFLLFETFIAVYETKSFTKASNYLYVSQPTVTIRIKKIESEIDTILFYREKHQEVSPTDAGIIFYREILKFLSLWNNIKLKITDNLVEKKVFKIGISQSATRNILPSIYKSIFQHISNLEIEFFIYNSEKVFNLVDEHKLHFGIIEKPMISNNIEKFFIMKDELVLAGNKDSGTFFIREEGSGVKYYSSKFLKEMNYIPKNIVQMNNNEMILIHIENNLGCSLVSKHFLKEEITYVELDENYHREFQGIFFLEEKDPIIKSLIDEIKLHLINNIN